MPDLQRTDVRFVRASSLGQNIWFAMSGPIPKKSLSIVLCARSPFLGAIYSDDTRKKVTQLGFMPKDH